MSQLIVEVVSIDDVKPHPNGNKLSIVTVKGWQVITKKNEYTVGQTAIFIPPQSIVPIEISNQYGFTQYLSTGGRVKSSNLRGEPSHGVLIRNDQNWKVGSEVAEKLGITKYVPPLPPHSGNTNDNRTIQPKT